MQNLLCPWDAPTYLIISSTAPTLLYYSYVPIIVISLFFSTYVLVKDGYSLLSKLLFLINIFFCLWVANIVFEWTSNNLVLQAFSWQLTAFFEMPISILIIYFSYVFLKRKDLLLLQKCGLILIMAPVLVLLPTSFNISSFYLSATDCGGNIGILWDYIYIFELLSIGIIAYLTYQSIRTSSDSLKRKETFLFGIATVIFMGLFFASGFFGDITNNYNINVIGPVAMVFFISSLGYIIVKFKTFHVKIFGAQALVASLAALIFAILFIRKIENVRYIVIATLLLTIILGRNLVRSVKREIEAKEKVEKLAAELEQANIQQESLIRFIGHEMKGYLTTSAGILASIVEGDFNPISDILKSSAESALSKVREGVRSVVEILSNANAKKGTLEYKMQTFDFGKMVLAGIAKLMPEAQEKGLALETGIKDDGAYMVTGDVDQISEHVVRNLIDNAIKYTPAGSIRVDLSKQGGKTLLSIRDTGVGITMEDKARLFTEGGRGKNSLATNVHSTGYGLAIAKKIVDAHSGRIWAESAGAGQGSQFYVELPEAK